MGNLTKRLFVASGLAVTLSAALLVAASAQPVPVPCYAFQQDALGIAKRMAATRRTISVGRESERRGGAPLSNEGDPKTLAQVQYRNHTSANPNPAR